MEKDLFEPVGAAQYDWQRLGTSDSNKNTNIATHNTQKQRGQRLLAFQSSHMPSGGESSSLGSAVASFLNRSVFMYWTVLVDVSPDIIIAPR